jgi:hypothetical protein
MTTTLLIALAALAGLVYLGFVLVVARVLGFNTRLDEADQRRREDS